MHDKRNVEVKAPWPVAAMKVTIQAQDERWAAYCKTQNVSVLPANHVPDWARFWDKHWNKKF